MNKKQVGALLKVMGKDNTRPALMVGKVDKYNDGLVLVATDGYKLAAVYLDEDAAELEGRLIRRDAIERWYKLATGKSRLTGEELVKVSTDDYGQHGEYQDSDYPKWQGLVPKGETQPQDKMLFNAEFFKIVQDLNGAEDVRVELYGPLSPMVVRSEVALSLVMPKKQ